jgi:SAM-dependent methyltransferase
MVSKRPVLEVGVGPGLFAARIKALAGVDPSWRMVLKAKSRGIPLVVMGRGEKLPFRSGSFGTVLIVVTLCFADDPVMMVKEAARVTEPGGYVVSCIIPADSSLGELYMKMAERGHPFYSSARFLRRRDHISLLEAAGLVVVDERGLEIIPGDQGFTCVKALRPPDR